MLDEMLALRDTLAGREDELRAEKAKFKDLEHEHRKNQETLVDLNERYKELKKESKWNTERYKHIIENYFRPFEQHIGHRYDDKNGPSIKAFLQPVFYSAAEAIALRDRIRILEKEHQESGRMREKLQALQSEMLARVEKVQAVSDEQFAKDFRVLVNMIKTLSRMIDYFEEVDPTDKLGMPILLDGVSARHWDGRSRMKSFIEPYVWSLLIHHVFQNPFSIFRDEGESVSEVWRKMFGTGHWHAWPCPTSSSETWRFTTVEKFWEMASPNTHEYDGDGMQPVDDNSARKLGASIMEANETVFSIIVSGLANVASAYDMSQIRLIVEKAFALSKQMSIQRCRLQVTFPSIGYSFVEGEMVQVRDDDEEDINGVVDFIHHPGLTKWGDAYGKNFDHKFDIVPSLVQVKPEKPSPQSM
jgi:hypothetical protein